METKKDYILTCPVPISKYPVVTLAHGGGGTLMSGLIEKMFLPAFDNEYLGQKHDSSVIELTRKKIAYTTDSYVIHPIFFPGGNIGSLAVHGTVNDLAMSGATPKYISVGLIIEEGFPMEDLWRIISSMKEAADKAGIVIATGDTKVIDKGKGDGIFINTSGIGIIEHELDINALSIKDGDAVIINGDIGRHGIAVMAKREGLEFESEIESDSASLNHIIKKLLDEKINIHCLRDLTRGGLSSALAELAEASGLEININEKDIPVREDVQGACEILGFDPLYVANEGRFVLFIPDSEAEKALEIISTYDEGNGAAIIGKAVSGKKGKVIKKSSIGTSTIVDKLSGEQLPRIC